MGYCASMVWPAHISCAANSSCACIYDVQSSMVAFLTKMYICMISFCLTEKQSWFKGGHMKNDKISAGMMSVASMTNMHKRHKYYIGLWYTHMWLWRPYTGGGHISLQSHSCLASDDTQLALLIFSKIRNILRWHTFLVWNDTISHILGRFNLFGNIKEENKLTSLEATLVWNSVCRIPTDRSRLCS